MKGMIVGCGVLAVVVGIALAAGPSSEAVGIATANALFLVNQAPVRGNATLFDGALIETRQSVSTIKLGNSLEIRMDAASRARVYRDRLVLERGAGLLSAGDGGRIQVRDLEVLPQQENTLAQITLNPSGQVEILASSGALDVRTPGGILIARVFAGHAMSFAPQAATAAPPFQIEGCLLTSGERYFLTDVSSNVNFELRGQDLAQFAGRYIQVSATQWPGANPSEEASQVLRVIQVKLVSAGCPAPPPRNGQDSGPRAARTVSASGKTKAVIAGVAIAGGVAGATVGLTGKEEQPTISR